MTSLNIPFTSTGGGQTASGQNIFVHLEQVIPDLSQQTVTMFDINQMVARAKSGLTAVSYKSKDCSASIINNTLSARFDLYAWPSDPSLTYSIKTNFGVVSTPQIISVPTEFSIVFDKSDVYQLDFILTKIKSAVWETPCFDYKGRVVKVSSVKLDGYTTIRTDIPIWGVLRVTGTKRGVKFSIKTTMTKAVSLQSDGSVPTESDYTASTGAGDFISYDDWLSIYYGRNSVTSSISGGTVTNATGISISNLQVTATAVWMGSDGKEKRHTITMKVPQCIKDLLSACGTDTNGDGIIDTWNFEDALAGSSSSFAGGSSVTIIPSGNPNTTENVYVSGCTGKVIDVKTVSNDDAGWGYSA